MIHRGCRLAGPDKTYTESMSSIWTSVNLEKITTIYKATQVFRKKKRKLINRLLFLSKRGHFLGRKYILLYCFYIGNDLTFWFYAFEKILYELNPALKICIRYSFIYYIPANRNYSSIVILCAAKINMLI